MTPPWLRLLDPSYRLTLAFNDHANDQLLAQRFRRRRPAPEAQDQALPTVPPVAPSEVVSASSSQASMQVDPPSAAVATRVSSPSGLSALSFHSQHIVASEILARGVEATTLIPRGILGPAFTGYTGRFGLDYRFSTALRPYLRVGGGNFYTQSPSPSSSRTIAEGGVFNAELGFILNEEGVVGGDRWALLGGHRTIGLGLNAYMFNSDVPTLLQMSVVNRTPLIEGSIPLERGALVLSANLFTSDPSLHLNDASVPRCMSSDYVCSNQRLIPQANSIPLMIQASWEMERSQRIPNNAGRFYPGELAPRILDLSTRQLGGFISMEDVPRYANTRALLESAPLGSVDSASASSLAHAGLSLSFMGLIFTQGRYAADFSQNIRRSQGWERAVLIGSQAATIGALWLGCGLSSEWPSASSLMRFEAGAFSDFSGRSACLQAPIATEAFGLGMLDGYGLTGDPNTSPLLFWVTHGIAAAAGFVALINYTRPFGEDPDTLAFSGGRGVTPPSQHIQSVESRFRNNALLAAPLAWAAFSYFNRRTPFSAAVVPMQQGAMATLSRRF